MPAKSMNMMIDQGSTVNMEFSLTTDNGDPYDLSNCTARAQMRKHYESNTFVAFTCNTANSKVTLSLTAVQSANISPGRHVFDIEIVNTVANTVTRVIEGTILVRPEVSR